jgi:hypothetical protein
MSDDKPQYADKSPLGWEVNSKEWRKFTRHVGDSWARDDETIRFELQRAMREYCYCESDLAATERQLRSELGVHKYQSLPGEYAPVSINPKSKRKIGIRVFDTLQNDFRGFVDDRLNGSGPTRYYSANDGHTTYGEALNAAIAEYRQGGRSARVLELAQRFVNNE